MGGSIEIKSEEGVGSSFIIRIPFKIASAPIRVKEQKTEATIENLNLRLAEYGQPELGRMRDYWNSTEADAKRAHILVFTNAPFKSYTKGTEKFAERFVRAVHKF